MKGILFNDWKIKAIAEDDREWQTRRVIKPQPTVARVIDIHSPRGKPRYSGTSDYVRHPDGGYAEIGSKYGLSLARYQVGEVVYIKEELLLNPIYGEAGYRDGSPVFIYNDELIKTRHILKWRWRSDVLLPRCMPREAARYFIKITDIRAERLQEITLTDIRAEGIGQEWLDARGLFRGIWDSINPKYPWESNPWVFAYSFKKAEK